MSIRKCPNCGLPIAGLTVCPGCGYNAGAEAPRRDFGSGQFRQESPQRVQAEEVREKAKAYAEKTKVHLTVWDILFLILCNVSIVLIVVNASIGGIFWSPYAVLGLIATYFFAFSCASKTWRRFLTRFRNMILVLNLATILFELIALAFSAAERQFATEFLSLFIPCATLLASCAILCFLASKDVPVRSVLLSLVLLLPCVLIQLIFSYVPIPYTSGLKVYTVLIWTAFGVTLVSIVNLVIIYFVKYRDKVVETFRFWE